MSTHNIFFLWRNKTNIMWIHHLIWSYDFVMVHLSSGVLNILTCNAIAIWTNHSTNCLSSNKVPLCSFNLLYKSPPSQNCIAIYKNPSFSNESLYETILGCFNLDNNLASCSADFRSLVDAFFRLIFFKTYWKDKKIKFYHFLNCTVV